MLIKCCRLARNQDRHRPNLGEVGPNSRNIGRCRSSFCPNRQDLGNISSPMRAKCPEIPLGSDFGACAQDLFCCLCAAAYVAGQSWRMCFGSFIRPPATRPACSNCLGASCALLRDTIPSRVRPPAAGIPLSLSECVCVCALYLNWGDSPAVGLAMHAWLAG